MFGIMRVLDERGIFFPATYSMGNVEIRAARSDTPDERQALVESQQKFGEKDDLTLSSRIFTVVDTNDIGEANALSAERFEEALDILASQNFGISRIALRQSGCMRNFARFDVVERLEPSRARRIETSTSFRIMPWEFPPLDISQYLARQAQESQPGNETLLPQRLVRSYHWARKAQLEPNRQMKILFRWFSMESIWTSEDGASIVPRIMWALGFPQGQGQLLLSRAFMSRILSHPTYSSWKSEVYKRLDALRIFRNDSVHSGFRAQDRTPEELRGFLELTTWGCARVQGQAASAIIRGIRTVEEFRDYLPLLVEENESYINDAHGTIIWSLENRTMWADE